MLKYRIDSLGNSTKMSDNEITARIYYKENSDSVFDKKKSIVQKNNISQPNDVSVSIPSRKIYGLKIEFSDIENRIKLSEIILKGKTKLRIENEAETVKDSSDFIFENGALISLQSKKNTELIIIDKFDFPAHLKIHYRIFIIVLSLSLLIFWKLINYLARFKIAENHSRLDIIFACVFFALLIVPSLNTNKDNVSLSENRMLAVYDPLIREGKINNSFGKNFDLWFNDRFFGRKEMIGLNKSIISFSNDKLENVKSFEGKNNWLFYKGENSIANYSNIHLFSEEELSYIANYLSSLQEWCEKNNKKFYFLICPDKNKIYGEFYPDYINKINPDEKSRTNQLISFLNAKTKVKTIYPYSELIKHKSDHLLYYMNDTHWNPFGAYIGYTELMKAVNENYNMEVLDLKNMKIIKVAGCWSGYGDLMIKNGLFNYSKMVQYPELKVDYEKKSMEGMEKDDEYYYTKKGKHSIFFFRDSFATDMRPYIANTFERSFFRRRYQLNKQDLNFMKENFDIIVFEIVERSLPIFVYIPLIFPEDSRGK